MFPFSKTKKDDSKKVYIPVDLVLRYSAQGLSEPDIIARLESQGFHPDHIDKALRIALREKIVSGAPPSPMAMSQQAPEAPSPMPFGAENQMQPMPQMNQRQPMPLGYPPERIVERPQVQPMEEFPEPMQQIPQPKQKEEKTSPTTEITVEEIIEAIVAERWKDFEDRLDVFEQRDIQLQNQLEEIRRKESGLEVVLKEKEESIVSKLDEFGDSVEGIQGRIGSIERVFKDFLPELTSNIKTMSNLVETIKKEKESH